VVGWNAGEAWVTVRDDGPGFASDILSRLGEPYISTGSTGAEDPGQHMGLGVFIARTLLTRTGGEVSFANRRPGAEVHVRWPRTRLESEPASLNEAKPQ
jgi:two-component system sensor histidine kinase RegB